MDLNRADFEEHWQHVAALYARAGALLAELDALNLYEAGAHLSMAMHAMREAHPDLSLAEPGFPANE
ncbi:MAG: hypothetical protein E6G94_08015 [Alphaproteobacteria bacterium]|nr:MAG: hypothetical protein E6G94_08015 [Alphaproteobacteria bacterium]